MKMKGIFMNINTNLIFQKILPYIYIILFVFIICNILFLYLPKNGVDFIKNESTVLSYKKYTFYSISTDNINENINNAKQTIQNLSKYDLKGIYSTIGNKGWIIIEEKAGTNSSYVLSQNEQIDGYTIFKLYKDYVIFQKDKRDYKLEILEKELSNTDYIKNSIKEDIVIKNNGAIINRDYLNSYITNLDKIWNNITLSDVKNGDKLDGFKIERINKDSFFSKLSLKEGDVIKSVNSVEMNSQAQALKVFTEINNTKYLNIKVLRNNEIMEMNYEVN